MRVPGAWVALLVLLAWQCPQLAGGQVYSVSPALKKDREWCCAHGAPSCCTARHPPLTWVLLGAQGTPSWS